MNLEVKSIKLISLVLLAVVFLSGCKDEGTTERLAEVDPNYKVEVVRFDKNIADMDTDGLEASVAGLVEDNPAFSDLYFGRVMPMKPLIQPADLIREMKSDTPFVALVDRVQNTYPDMQMVSDELSQALENYGEVFDVPTSELPTLYTFISGFAYQTFVFDDGGKDGVGLGLDMFLGDDFPYHTIDPQNSAFSRYITRTFNQEHMAKKAIEVLIEDKLPPPSGSDFLSLIIWGGKKLYVMDQILDFVPDSIITQYTADQMAWCRGNHAEMWDFFFDSELFYSTQLTEYNKLIGPAPTSPGMPPESPGSTGNYMGWQVVNAYMNRYPKTTISELLQMDDAQQILDESRYRPG